MPVVVENDANCAGWGEYVHGAGQGSSNMVALTVGTGLGGAIVINGQLYRGSFGMAAELGHLPMVPDGDHCGCGLRGCAERYTSGTSLENFAKSAVRRRPQDAKRLMELCGGDISKLEGPMVSPGRPGRRRARPVRIRQRSANGLAARWPQSPPCSIRTCL